VAEIPCPIAPTRGCSTRFCPPYHDVGLPAGSSAVMRRVGDVIFEEPAHWHAFRHDAADVRILRYGWGADGCARSRREPRGFAVPLARPLLPAQPGSCRPAADPRRFPQLGPAAVAGSRSG
jgi:hypothetical protein